MTFITTGAGNFPIAVGTMVAGMMVLDGFFLLIIGQDEELRGRKKEAKKEEEKGQVDVDMENTQHLTYPPSQLASQKPGRQ